MFMGAPDHWFENWKLRCLDDHVTSFVIKSEAVGASLCPKCMEPLALTFPGDTDGPLKEFLPGTDPDT